MATKVVNLKRFSDETPGVHYDVYIGRKEWAPYGPVPGADGMFGNPVKRFSKCPVCGSLHRHSGTTLPCFKAYFLQRLEVDPVFRTRVESLRDQRLACFCVPDKPCHGQYIAAWLDGLPMPDELPPEEEALADVVLRLVKNTDEEG